tara:strand:- start:585 stop:917 length:333 start_codon:yes stop_codon:yes gene_type:complete
MRKPKTPETPYTYIFVRKDMKMVYYAIQAAHAAQEAGIKFGAHESGQQIHFAMFEVRDELALFKASKYLEKHGVEFVMFHETDDDTGFTAIATKPYTDKKEVMRGFHMFR